MPKSDMSKGPNPEVLREVQSSGISEEVKQTSIAFLEKFADASTHLAHVEEDAVHIDIPHFVCLPDQPEGVSVSLTASIGRDIEISLEEFFGAFEGHGATYEEAFDFLEYLQEGSCASLNALFERSRLLLRQFCAAGIPAPNLNPCSDESLQFEWACEDHNVDISVSCEGVENIHVVVWGTLSRYDVVWPPTESGQNQVISELITSPASALEEEESCPSTPYGLGYSEDGTVESILYNGSVAISVLGVKHPGFAEHIVRLLNSNPENTDKS